MAWLTPHQLENCAQSIKQAMPNDLSQLCSMKWHSSNSNSNTRATRNSNTEATSNLNRRKNKQSELSEKNKSNSVWSLEFLQLTRQQQQQKQQQHGFRSTAAALHAQRQQLLLLLLLLLSPVVNSMMISLLSQSLLSPFFSLQSPFTSTSHDMQMRLGNWLNWKCNRSNSNSTAATFDFSIRARVSSRCKDTSTCLQIHTDIQPATCVIHHDTKQFPFATTTWCPCGNHSFSHTVS